MNAPLLDRATAEAFAQAYRCLADPTRILVLNRLAGAGAPLSVREIVDQVDVGQSTVSHHLRVLLDAGFVRVSYQGTSSLFEVNTDCSARFPATANAILNQAPAGTAACVDCEPANLPVAHA